MNAPKKDVPLYEKILRPVLWTAVTLLVVLACVYIGFQLVTGFQRYQQNDDAVLESESITDAQRRMLDRAESALDRANESAEMAGTILSFLEGASVLVALALGAAAIFGFQNSRELREDIQEERDKIEVELGKFDDLWKQIEPHKDTLTTLDDQLAAFKNTQQSIQDSFGDLLQASQELSLKNYREAYHYAQRVLERSSDNILALYIAGWLETQYIPGTLESACQRFEQAISIDPASPSIKAAYGVALRRMALAARDENDRRSLIDQSLGKLLDALGNNPNLIDLNRESFWGPVGGNYRDKNQLDPAIEAYERALNVTPGSSYPMGNLGALYLLKAKNASSKEFRDKALEAFRLTAVASEGELRFNPNDYFVLMDLAMSYTEMAEENNKNYDEAHHYLTQALSEDIGATPGMLRVSLGGWRRLLEACPEEWEQVRQAIVEAIQAIEKVIEERQTPE
ncbi:MAG: hypothetical protein K8I82_23060 [Anaerolineae bacterium]|nr:hypothetical protein [Anaerolineae bacterium]